MHNGYNPRLHRRPLVHTVIIPARASVLDAGEVNQKWPLLPSNEQLHISSAELELSNEDDYSTFHLPPFNKDDYSVFDMPPFDYEVSQTTHCLASLSPCHTRWLKLTSGFFFVYFVLWYFVFRVNVCLCCIRFGFFSTSPEIGWEEHLRIDLFCDKCKKSLHKHILNHLDIYSILTQYQQGFRKAHSRISITANCEWPHVFIWLDPDRCRHPRLFPCIRHCPARVPV